MTRIEALEEAKRIFDQAVDLPANQRASFLESCVCSPEVRLHLDRMLEKFHDGTSLEGAFVAGPVTPSISAGGDDDFTGTARFIVRRRLGSGAFGTVYEAFDKEQSAAIALKVLRRCKPETLFRFKREFRSLVNTRHHNLVHLYELILEDGHWFFTMELIDGVDFIEYVRSPIGSCDYSKLRESLRQLVDAVSALHRAKRLHRDLKPANVLVTSAGRLVVLDFGLIKELEERISDQAHSLVGTPAYMSPEQTERLELGSASDWYSVGVMLFQALTGRLPHGSTLVQRWVHDSEPQSDDTHIFGPDVPADLSELCRRLLNRSPKARPNAEEILVALSRTTKQNRNSIEQDQSRQIREIFVGRSAEIDALQSAFADTLARGLNVVLIEGKSGIGKSALVRHFLTQLRHTRPNLLVLSGRCYEFESVPYKGLDTLVDELSQHLQRMPDAKLQAVLPREAFLLPKLFPVLGRVKALDSAPIPPAAVPDAQELRQRTFAALRELFARLADRQPVVVWIDDLQWADRDSASFLAELCAPPLQPPLLLLLTYRAEETSSNATLQHLRNMIAEHQKASEWRHLSLTGLAREDSFALFKTFLDPDSKEHVSSKVVDEAGGHPLFLQELARFIGTSGGLSAEHPVDIGLKSFLRRRVEELPPDARELLELISIAVQPISIPVLFAASSAANQLDSLALLIRENLARTAGGSDERREEPFHDQVRSVVVDSMPKNLRKMRHGQLASALASMPGAEAQILVTHYKEAGEARKAFEAALTAAEGAERQLAFDRAATFYEAALDTGTFENEKRQKLLVKLAESLGKAGRGRDAAKTYLIAARSGQDSFEMRRSAADQFMRSGYIDEALELFGELARKIGITTPDNPGITVRRMLWGRVRARTQLMWSGASYGAIDRCGNDMKRLELLKTGGLILGSADSVLAAYYQVQYVCEALHVKDSKHLAVALAIESSIRAAPGSRHPESSLALLRRAEEIATLTGDPNTIGTVQLVLAYVDYLLGNVPQGIEHCNQAIAFLRERCTGVAWELTAAHIILLFFLCWSGQVGKVRSLLPQLLREGVTRGDVNVQVSFRLLSYAHYYYLSDDDARDCLTEGRLALARWSTRGFHLQHYGALFAEIECHLYMGNYALAREHLLKMWQPMSRSFILRWRILTVMALFLRGRVALACWLGTRRNDPALSAEVEYYAKKLDRIRFPWCRPMACALRGGLAAGRGEAPIALRFFEEAAKTFTDISLHMYAAAAQNFCGLLRDGEQGREETLRSNQFLASQGVRNPQAFLSMLIPGTWLNTDG